MTPEEKKKKEPVAAPPPVRTPKFNTDAPLSPRELTRRLLTHEDAIGNLGDDIRTAQVAVKEIREEVKKSSGEVETVSKLMVGIVVVFFAALVGLFVAVDGMLIEHYNSKAASYQDLIRKLDQQGEKVNILSGKIDQQSSRIDASMDRFAVQLKKKGF